MNYIVPASVIVGIYFLLHIVGIGCPIRFLTGISCAGCGMTRAWLSVEKMDFKSAFYYHPLFFVPLIWLLGFCMRNRIGSMTKKIFIAVTVILFIFCYVMRMAYGDGEVVYFHPTNGLLFQIINIFHHG